MPDARELSLALAAKFLEDGNYSAAAGSMSRQVVDQIVPAAAAAREEFTDFISDDAFAGLHVQAVGYAAGGEERAVYIYVSKGSRRMLNELPQEADGVAVRGVRLAKLLVRPESASAATNAGNVFEHNARIACGTSCCPAAENYAGTLGAIVSLGRDLYILSNNHVIAACNQTPIGVPILAPANMDGRAGVRAPTEVGRHSRMVELRSGVPALVDPIREDAAIARLTHPDLVTSWQGGDDGYDTPGATMDPHAGLAVKKVGRTTGQTHGFVEAEIPSPTPIPYKSNHFTARVWLRDIWTVRSVDNDPFALGGDSGSLVVTENGEAAVGLLFAMAGEYGVIVPINRVLQALGGLQLVSGHGIA